MRYIIWIILVVNFYAGEAQSSEYVYSIGSENKEPVEIIPIEKANQRVPYMKDPLPPNVKLKSEVKKVVKLPKGKLKIKPAHLTLKKMTVRGSVSKPRVKFKRDRLPLGRVFEPMETNFINKVADQDPSE